MILRLVMTYDEKIQTLELTRREALSDSLTGLGNRRKLMLASSACAAGALTRPFYIALFDLDGFKLYNDRFGHPAGMRCSPASAAISGSVGPLEAPTGLAAMSSAR